MDNNNGIEVGWRIIFDQDGDIIHLEGEYAGDMLPRKELTRISYIDLDYGAVDLSKYDIIGVDVTTNNPILREIPTYETEEQRRIRELEDALLLAADAETGGIL